MVFAGVTESVVELQRIKDLRPSAESTFDFLLISPVKDYAPVRFERAWLSWTILGGVVVAATTGLLTMLKAAMLGAAAMLITGCCTVAVARKSIDVQVLLAIASAFALGKALEVTGAAETLAQGFLGLAGEQPWLVQLLTESPLSWRP